MRTEIAKKKQKQTLTINILNIQSWFLPKPTNILPSSITFIYYLLKICRGVPQGSIHEPLFL